MKSAHLTYLQSQGIQKPLIDRLIEVYNEVCLLHGKSDMEDILLVKSIPESDSLWLFYDNVIIECKNVFSESCFDFVLSSSIYYSEISKKNFDFITPNESSVFIIRAKLSLEMRIDIHAKSLNCIQALNIYKKYIMPKK